MERDFYAGTWQALAASVPAAIWIAIALAATVAVFILFHINTPRRSSPWPSRGGGGAGAQAGYGPNSHTRRISAPSTS